MKALLRGVAFLALAALLWGPAAWALPPEAGINSAGVIEFPTALNQTFDHSFDFSLEIVDIGEPDIRLENLRYGYQIGDFQLRLDSHYLVPRQEFNFLELRAKLRVLPLDEFSTDIAIGLLGRQVQETGDRVRIDDRSASLFGAITSRFFLFESTGPLLVNFYLDNLFVSLGAKLEFYQFISAVVETDMLHSLTSADDRTFVKAGVEVQGEQNFYFQVVYNDRDNNLLLQIGSGF